MTLREKALAAARREQMFPPDTTVVVGLSGGADSVALLHWLLSVREELSLAAVTAVHVNHGLRGEEAARDQQFAEQLCAAWQVPLTVVNADVAALAQEMHTGWEEAGRHLRYRALETAADAYSTARIATAHTATDNAETVLLHLCRGCGLHGLAGIPPVRGRVVRPLIDCSRAEIEDYCAAEGLAYVIDSTNTDVAYARNRIRQLVMPQLREINPQAEVAIGRLIARAREWDSAVTTQAEQALREVRRGTDIYDRAVLRGLSPTVLGAVWRRLLGECGEQRGSEVQIAQATALLERGGMLSLPGGRQLTVERETVRIGEPLADTPPFCYEDVTPNRDFMVGDCVWRLETLSREEYEQKLNILENSFANACDCDKISGSLRLRARQAGDAYRPAGRGCRKTLKKLFNEAALSVRERAEIPLLCDDEGIVLVGGFGCDERVRITEETQTVLVLKKRRM